MEDFFFNVGSFLCPKPHGNGNVLTQKLEAGGSLNPLPLISEATTHLTNYSSVSQAKLNMDLTVHLSPLPLSQVIYCFCFLIIKGVSVDGNASNNTNCKTNLEIPLVILFHIEL